MSMTVPTTAAMTAAANIVKVSLADMPFAQLLAERFPVVRQSDDEEPTDEDMEEEDLGECECLPCPTPEELAEMCEEDDDECLEMAANADPEVCECICKEDGGGILPFWIVFPVQVIALSFEWMTILTNLIPFQAMYWSFILFDFVTDLAFLVAFGLIPGIGKPLAYLFIWIVNLVFLPVTFAFWAYRIGIETIGLLFDGWLLLFGSGCYLRWGPDCWFAKKFSERSHRTYLDLPILALDPNAAGSWWDAHNSHGSPKNMITNFGRPDVERFNKNFVTVWGQERFESASDDYWVF